MKNLKKLLPLMLSLAIFFSIIPVQASVPTDNTSKVEDVIASEMEIKGSNSVGELLADALSEGIEQKTEQENAENYIFDLVVEGNNAIVQYAVREQADIVVAIYDEQTERMTASAAQTVNNQRTSVSMTLEGEMPRYYIAAAYMLDSKTHAPMCDSYRTNLYTESLQKLENATIWDYEEELVLNLDDDDSTNFVVYDKDTKVIDYQDGVNEVTDQGNGTYTVVNADSSFQNLKPGDVVSYTDSNGELLFLKVKSVSVESGVVTIREEADITLEDVFEDVKIEGGYADMEDPVSAASEKGIATYSDRSIETGVNASVEKTFGPLKKVFKSTNEDGSVDESDKKANLTISVSGRLKISAYIKLYLSKEKKYFETKVSFSGTVDASISGSTGRKTFDLLPEEVGLSPVPGVYINIMPSIVFESAMKLDFNAEVTACIGTAYNGSAWQNKSQRPKVSKCDLKAEGSVYLGFSMEPRVKILTDKVGDAKITAGYGATFSGTMDFLKQEKDVKHECEKCLDGKMKVDINVGASATFLKHFKASMDLVKVSFTPIDFYYSFDYEDWDFTTCPHKRYKIILTAKDANGNPISGARVMGTFQSEDPVTGNDGKAEFYMQNGTHNVSVEKDNLKGTGTFKVEKAKQDVTVTLKAKVYKVLMNVKDPQGNPVSFAKIEGTGLDTDPLTINGKAEFSLENGSYDLTVSKDGMSAKVNIAVQGKDQDVEVKLEETVTVKITLTAKDSDGNPVSGALVSGTGLGTAPVTDSGGMVEFYVPEGTYDLSVAKGDLSGKVNVVVEDENDSVILNIVLKRKEIPEDAFEWNGHYYKLYTASMSWGAAQMACENIGGHLVTITSEDEQIAVYGYIKKTTTEDVDIMIGLNNSELGSWSTWVTGEKVIYTNWGNKQPDNFTGGQNTGVICTGIRDGGSRYYIRPGEWDDNNDGNYWYLCEWESEVLDEENILGTASDCIFESDFQSEDNLFSGFSNLIFPSEEEVSSIVLPQENATAVPMAVNTRTVTSNERTIAEFTGLAPGAAYTLLVMKNADAENIISPDNLLYIYQQSADQSGKIILSYVPRTNDSAYAKAYGSEPDLVKDIGFCTVELSSANYTYDGEAKEPKVTVKNGSDTLAEGKDYTVIYQDNINAGKAAVIIKGIGCYTGTQTVNFIITYAPEPDLVKDISFCTIELSSASYTYDGEAKKPKVTVKNASDTLAEGRDYTVSYQDNINAGKAAVIIKGIGNYTGIKTANFTIKKAKNKLTASNIVRTASGKKQSFSIGVKAEQKTKLTYATNNKSKVSISSEGKVTIARDFIGKAEITITSPAVANYEKASKKITITIKPAKVKLSGVKNIKGRKIKVKWKKSRNVSGYQIQYSTSKNFSKGVKKVKVSGAKKVSKNISGLKKGKTYFVRIRAYKKISTGTLSSDWSSGKKVTISK